jgi:hypothetical protein
MTARFPHVWLPAQFGRLADLPPGRGQPVQRQSRHEQGQGPLDRNAALDVLRKGLGYAYAELASLLRISAPNARVVVHRAQARLESGRERPVPVESHRRLAAAFRTAAHTGDLDGLVKVLAPST